MGQRIVFILPEFVTERYLTERVPSCIQTVADQLRSSHIEVIGLSSLGKEQEATKGNIHLSLVAARRLEKLLNILTLNSNPYWSRMVAGNLAVLSKLIEIDDEQPIGLIRVPSHSFVSKLSRIVFCFTPTIEERGNDDFLIGKECDSIVVEWLNWMLRDQIERDADTSDV